MEILQLSLWLYVSTHFYLKIQLRFAMLPKPKRNTGLCNATPKVWLKQNRRQKVFNRGALRLFGGALGLCGGA